MSYNTIRQILSNKFPHPCPYGTYLTNWTSITESNINLVKHTFFKSGLYNHSSGLQPGFLIPLMLCVLLLMYEYWGLQIKIDRVQQFKKLFDSNFSLFSEFLLKIYWEQASKVNIFWLLFVEMYDLGIEPGPYVVVGQHTTCKTMGTLVSSLSLIIVNKLIFFFCHRYICSLEIFFLILPALDSHTEHCFVVYLLR